MPLPRANRAPIGSKPRCRPSSGRAGREANETYQLLPLGLSTDDLGAFALVNGVSALVTFWFGARLFIKPTRSLVGWSIFWAIFSVVGGVYQLSQGIGNDVHQVV